MPKKKDLDFLIARIKAATGLKQDGIAKAINYSRAHFSTMKSSSPNELYDLLETHFDEALKSKSVLEEAEAHYNLPKDKLEEEKAMLQVLFLEVAKLKSKSLGISIDNAIDELMQNTKIVLKQMKGGA